MTAVLRLGAFVAVLMVALAAAQCSQYTSCGTCISGSTCGWCDATSMCSVGTANGPSQGTCANWHWTQCPQASQAPGSDPCNAFSGSCVTCTDQLACGYCQSNNMCMTGGSTGPITGTCMQWIYLPFECNGSPTNSAAPSNQCGQYSTCADCTANFPCGWCPSTSMCEVGSSTGPSQGSCAGWAWVQPQCPTAPANCGASTDCVSCTEMSSCGWCASTMQCMSGNEFGPTQGSCANWDWIDFECQAPTTTMPAMTTMSAQMKN